MVTFLNYDEVKILYIFIKSNKNFSRKGEEIKSLPKSHLISCSNVLK